MRDSAILAYMNEIVDRVNAQLMERLPGDYLIAHSIDHPSSELDVHQADANTL